MRSRPDLGNSSAAALFITLGLASAETQCAAGLCLHGRLDSGLKYCCASSCSKRCGGPGCGADDNGGGAEACCPARFAGGQPSRIPTCAAADQTSCRMPSGCAGLAAGKARVRVPRTTKRPSERTNSSMSYAGATAECRCHGPFTRTYRGQCLPSFMVIGSQKAATSKLRWYLSRHPSIDIPKEEAFHGGPNAVAAWDTKENPSLLSAYLEAFEDVCNSSDRITGLKMPYAHGPLHAMHKRHVEPSIDLVPIPKCECIQLPCLGTTS